MKLTDLRSGMMVVTRTGRTGIVLLNTDRGDIIASDRADYERKTWNSLESYDADLNCIPGDLYSNFTHNDIVEVWNCANSNCYAVSFDKRDRELIWSRSVVSEVIGDNVIVEINPKQEEVEILDLKFSFADIEKLYNKIKDTCKEKQ